MKRGVTRALRAVGRSSVTTSLSQSLVQNSLKDRVLRPTLGLGVETLRCSYEGSVALEYNLHMRGRLYGTNLGDTDRTAFRVFMSIRGIVMAQLKL